MDKQEEVKKLAEQIGYQEMKNILDNLENEESNYEKAKKWFKEEILKKVSIHQDRCCPNSLLFCMNDKVVMEQDSKNDRLCVKYDKIWSFFKSEFSLNDQEITDLIKQEVEEHFKMKVSTPSVLYLHHYYNGLRNISK